MRKKTKTEKKKSIINEFILKHLSFERVQVRYCGCKDFVGGNWNNGDKAGVSYLNSNNDAGKSNRNNGAHAARGNTPHCLEQYLYPRLLAKHSIRSEKGQYPLSVGTKSREILPLRNNSLYLCFSLSLPIFYNSIKEKRRKIN